MSSLQHSSLLERNLALARQIAQEVLSEEGLDRGKLFALRDRLKKTPVHHRFDLPAQQHVLDALDAVLDRPHLHEQIERFYKPVNFLFGDELIRQTLALPPGRAVTDLDAKKAALISLLTYLRQKVGSCFATAPALWILQQRRELFLTDAQTMLATGQMKRVIRGKEISVPISPNWGRDFDAQKENALLRSWEYTMASFSEAKADFVGWNLFHSLGFGAEEEDSLGYAARSFLQETLNRLNDQVAQYQEQYERLFLEVKALESRLNRSGSEWDRADYRGRLAEMESWLDRRDDAHEKASACAELYPKVVSWYVEIFPEFFQEVYDAVIDAQAQEHWEDSPAGFRLLYKHGRQNPSTWTLIHNEDEYTAALTQFFQMTEQRLIEAYPALEREIADLVTELIRSVRSKGFVEAATARVQKIRGQTEHCKPWEYTSGGNLSTLLANLLSLEEPPQAVEKKIPRPEELFIFYLELLKDAPASLTTPFIKYPRKTLLATSPTHAFLLLPGAPDFRASWDNNLYTPTWVRDNITEPRRNFFTNCRLSSRDIQDLFSFWQAPEKLKEKIMKDLPSFASPYDLAQAVRIPSFEAQIYAHLPFLSEGEFLAAAEKCSSALGFPLPPQSALPTVFSAETLRQWLCSQPTQLPDSYLAVSRFLEEEGLAAPRAIVIADTNWDRPYFAFQMDLVNERLGLFLSDYSGTIVTPFREWNGTFGADARPWGLYPL